MTELEKIHKRHPVTPGIAREMVRLAAAGVVLMVCVSAHAQVPSWARGTWPPIDVSTTVINNQVVAVGRTQGANGGAAWQVALAPAGPGVTANHGVWSTFVEVGTRQFVIDNASGHVRELRNGQVWRQWGPGTVPVAPPQSPIPPYAQPAPGQLGELTPPQREALQAAAGAENGLLVALRRMEALAAREPALSQEMKDALVEARSSQGDVSIAWARLRDEFRTVTFPLPPKAVPPSSPPTARAKPGATTQPAPAAQPPATALTREAADARQHLLQVGAALQRTQSDLTQLRGRKEATETDLREADSKVQALRGQEEAALVAFRKAQLTAEIQRAAALDPSLRAPLVEAAQRILVVTSRQYRTQSALQDLRSQKGAGPEGSAQLDQAASELMAEMKNLQSAQARFDELLAKAGQGRPASAAPGEHGQLAEH